MPDTHLPLHDARTTTERLFPTLPAAHIARISTHGYGDRISSVRNPSLHMPTSADQVWAALAWGAVPSVGLLVGAIAGSFSRMPHQRIAMAMSVGAGLLLAGVSLKVAADAIRVAGPVAAALSLLLGAAVFSASNALLARFGAAHRKRCGECIQQPTESQQPGSGVAIALGNALDAAPEAVVLGIALRDPVVPFALVIAFSLGNLPVALSSTAGMRAAGRRYPYIFLLWSAIAIGAAVAIVAGYVGFGSLSQAWPPRLQAFGAGALLAMAAETMIPEAFHNSPRFSGLLAAFGFGLLLLVDATTTLETLSPVGPNRSVRTACGGCPACTSHSDERSSYSS